MPVSTQDKKKERNELSSTEKRVLDDQSVHSTVATVMEILVLPLFLRVLLHIIAEQIMLPCKGDHDSDWIRQARYDRRTREALQSPGWST